MDALEFGVQHRSNGQTTEVTEPTDAPFARHACAGKQREFFDTISRSADFVSVALDKQWQAPGAAEALLRAKLKLYWQQDAAVTWGPLNDAGRRFSDYDRVPLRASAKWNKLTGELQCVVQAQVQRQIEQVPLHAKGPGIGRQALVAESPGPMNTLANYTQRQDSIGFGRRLARF